jgi:hypothetical protein
MAFGDPYDLQIEFGFGSQITIVYLASIVNKNEVEDHLLTTLSSRVMAEKNSTKLTWDDLIPLVAKKGRGQRSDMPQVFQDLLAGFAVIHLKGNHNVYSFDVHKVAKRQPTDPQEERSIRDQGSPSTPHSHRRSTSSTLLCLAVSGRPPRTRLLRTRWQSYRHSAPLRQDARNLR